MGFSVKRLSSTFVGKVEGIDLSNNIDQALVETICALLVEYKVLVICSREGLSDIFTAFSRIAARCLSSSDLILPYPSLLLICVYS